MAKILIIDDDIDLCRVLSAMVTQIGHDSTFVLTLEDGLNEVWCNAYDIVLLDINMPDGDGLTALPEILKTSPSTRVIIITGEGDPEGAELAIKKGAWDYMQKPLSVKKLIPLIESILKSGEALRKTRRPLATIKRDQIIGDSPKMTASLDILAQAAQSEANVLITGETGTGKELFARAVHENSRKSGNNFVVIDCGALPELLVESVLFGHEKGAFTGANRAREGLVKQADGGTLFLDEVGELPLSLQKAFLRVLQEHRFRPVGSNQEIKSCFRLVAATNRDLNKMVKCGQFRSDLLFRLRAFILELPALREHPEDIEALTRYYVKKLCKRYRINEKGFSPDFFSSLALYKWPGNVRELVNTLDTALTAARNDDTLVPYHLPLNIRAQVAKASVRKEISLEAIQDKDASCNILPPLKDYRTAAAMRAEQQYLQVLLSLCQENMEEACRISRLSRSRLYELLKKRKVFRPEERMVQQGNY